MTNYAEGNTMTTTSELAVSLTMDMCAGNAPYPFTEDENANITGYGHQDPATFAAEINRFEVEVCEEDPDDLTDWTDRVFQTYVYLDDDGERLHQCASTDLGAFPVTVLWGAR